MEGREYSSIQFFLYAAPLGTLMFRLKSWFKEESYIAIPFPIARVYIVSDVSKKIFSPNLKPKELRPEFSPSSRVVYFAS